MTGTMKTQTWSNADDGELAIADASGGTLLLELDDDSTLSDSGAIAAVGRAPVTPLLDDGKKFGEEDGEEEEIEDGDSLDEDDAAEDEDAEFDEDEDLDEDEDEFFDDDEEDDDLDDDLDDDEDDDF